ncbi:MAG: preprotein translocase subunit SecG [Sphingobium sp.]
MFTFLLVVQAIIAAALVAVILMQRSEGGGLGVGGSPAGLMSARGAADFLTRTTTVLAILFVGLSITLAVLASIHQAPSKIDTSLVKDVVPAAGGAPANTPVNGDALAGAAQSVGNSAAANQSVPLVK